MRGSIDLAVRVVGFCLSIISLHEQQAEHDHSDDYAYERIGEGSDEYWHERGRQARDGMLVQSPDETAESERYEGKSAGEAIANRDAFRLRWIALAYQPSAAELRRDLPTERIRDEQGCLWRTLAYAILTIAAAAIS